MKDGKIKVGIVGASGYTGLVLIRILLEHPQAEISYLGSNNHAGKSLSTVCSTFFNTNLKFKNIDSTLISKSCDVVFFATPNGFSEKFSLELLKNKSNIKIIDLSADFRESKNKNVAYGLPEINRKEIKKANIIANPGCYPTSIILGLAPVLRENLIDVHSIISDSKSGISGAGKTPKQELQFVEVNESFTPYKLGGVHRHVSEIEYHLKTLCNSKTKHFNVIFSPHLLPVNRGIISTIYADLNEKISASNLEKLYTDFYKEEFFVEILKGENYPNIKDVRHSNFCILKPIIDMRKNKLIVVSCIDNMVKGASGQAVQNMNILFGIEERTALTTLGHIP